MKTPFLLLITVLFLFSFSDTHAQTEAWIAPENAKEIENIVPEKKRDASAKKGSKVFKARCVFCHGKAAKGDGLAGARLNPKPADLTSANVQSQTDGEIFWKITNGRGSMPQWKAIVSEEERWDLVNFIRSVNGE